MPTARVRRSSGVVPRLARRAPFRPVAPTMIGRAMVRERRFACSREKRRQRAAARVTPLRETPGASAAAWATPRARPSIGVASPRPRSCSRRSADHHQRGAEEEAEGGRPRAAEPSLDLALEAVADRRRRGEGEDQQERPAGVEAAAAPRRSAAAGRSGAPPRRRCGARPRSSCAPPGRSRPSPSPAARGRGRCGRSWRPAAARRGPARSPARSRGTPAAALRSSVRGRRRLRSEPSVEPVGDAARRSPRRRCSRGSRGVRATFPIRPRPRGRATRSRSPRGSSRARSAR